MSALVSKVALIPSGKMIMGLIHNAPHAMLTVYSVVLLQLSALNVIPAHISTLLTTLVGMYVLLLIGRMQMEEILSVVHVILIVCGATL